MSAYVRANGDREQCSPYIVREDSLTGVGRAHERVTPKKANDSLRLLLPKGNPWTKSKTEPRQEVKKLSFLRGVEWNSTKSEPIKAKRSFALLYTKGINAKGV